MKSPNKPDAPNPAVAPRFQVERHWRGVGELARLSMRLPRRSFLVGVGVALLATVLFWLCGGLRIGSAPTRLAVVFVNVQNDPVSHPPKGPTVLHGGLGLCAIFAVTNVGTDASMWFRTSAVEHRVGEEWRRNPVPPYRSRVVDQLRTGGKPWFLIDSDDVNDVFPPGRGWYYAVPWPPDVPTNAVWRLELRYGRLPSPRARKVDDQLGVRLFARRGQGRTLVTPEVRR